jgi:hypothetical protein
MMPVTQESGLALYALEFDLHSRMLLSDPITFGSDVPKALQYFTYLESRALEDLSREVVLLGCSSSVDELEVTHLRYFQPRGIPDLPKELRPDQLRPESRALISDVHVSGTIGQ